MGLSHKKVLKRSIPEQTRLLCELISTVNTEGYQSQGETEESKRIVERQSTEGWEGCSKLVTHSGSTLSQGQGFK